MRLIDADELLIYIKEEIKQDRPDDFKILNIKRVVEDTPTAYDVNKVVKKLEELRADYRNDYDYDVSFGIGMAIGIVKEGIKNE